VSARETPLAAYLFAGSSVVKKRWETEVASGGMAINDVVRTINVAIILQYVKNCFQCVVSVMLCSSGISAVLLAVEVYMAVLAHKCARATLYR
jgi:hypothetical protein